MVLAEEHLYLRHDIDDIAWGARKPNGDRPVYLVKYQKSTGEWWCSCKAFYYAPELAYCKHCEGIRQKKEARWKSSVAKARRDLEQRIQRDKHKFDRRVLGISMAMKYMNM